MKTASMVLGIVGGIIVMIWGLFNISSLLPVLLSFDISAVDLLLGKGLCIVGAGILGLIGGIIVRNKNVAAGVIMIIAAVLSIFAYFNLIAIILFILGAIFAFMREKPVNPYPPYFQPTYPYCQYPQYPYPQQAPEPQNSQSGQETPQQ